MLLGFVLGLVRFERLLFSLLVRHCDGRLVVLGVLRGTRSQNDLLKLIPIHVLRLHEPDRHVMQEVEVGLQEVLSPPVRPVNEVLHLLVDDVGGLMETENMDGDGFEKIVLASGAAQYTKDDEPSITVPYQK